MDEGRDELQILVSGIERDADAEAAAIEEEARLYAAGRAEAAKAQAEAIVAEALGKAEAQRSSILKNAVSRLATGIKINSLALSERAIKRTLELALGKCRERISSLAYPKALEDWIAEAAIGLSAERALVNASAEEKAFLKPELIERAETRASAYLQRTVRLSPSPEAPLSGQGIVLTAADGRLAYNNQVETRFLRADTAIRKKICDTLFGEDS